MLFILGNSIDILAFLLTFLFVFERNVLSESARIARGKIEALDKIDASSHDALFFPRRLWCSQKLVSVMINIL